MQFFLCDRLATADVDIGHPEGGGESLGGAEFPGQFVPEPGVMADVGITGGVDHDSGLDLLQPRFGGDHQTGDPSVLDGCILHEGMQEDAAPALTTRSSQTTFRCSAR